MVWTIDDWAMGFCRKTIRFNLDIDWCLRLENDDKLQYVQTNPHGKLYIYYILDDDLVG